MTDKYANQEILSVCLRFLDLKIKEVFLTDFVNLDKTTVAFTRRQEYNGASGMSSEARGVQGRIGRIAPMALYTHCNSHD